MKKRALKGSFTVELGLLMTLILPVLTALLYLGFYMHDRAFLTGAALETACAAALNWGEDTREAAAEKKKEEFLERELLGTSGLQGSVSIKGESVEAEYSGIFELPGFVSGLFGLDSLRIQANAGMDLKNPRREVNRIHSLAALTRRDDG